MWRSRSHSAQRGPGPGSVPADGHQRSGRRGAALVLDRRPWAPGRRDPGRDSSRGVTCDASRVSPMARAKPPVCRRCEGPRGRHAPGTASDSGRRPAGSRSRRAALRRAPGVPCRFARKRRYVCSWSPGRHRENRMPARGRAGVVRDEALGGPQGAWPQHPAFARPPLTHVACARHPLPLAVGVAAGGPALLGVDVPAAWSAPAPGRRLSRTQS